MTRLPADSWNVKGVEHPPKYKVGPKCAVANCGRFADHAHHIWRRSFLAGDYRWVELWDGTVVQNLCALCWEHHQRITENKDDIACIEDDGQWLFVYYTANDHIAPLVLVPQPKQLEDFVKGEVGAVVVPTEPEECPTCGHRKHNAVKSALPAGEKRDRATWTVSVPKDERENGAEVLDELELACAEKLGRAEHSGHKYYTLAEVMATFLLGNVETVDFESS